MNNYNSLIERSNSGTGKGVHTFPLLLIYYTVKNDMTQVLYMKYKVSIIRIYNDKYSFLGSKIQKRSLAAPICIKINIYAF